MDASIRAGLWGLALLIAAQCPVPAPGAQSPSPAENEGGDAAPPQPPYQRVVRLYANAFLHTGTPLHTMALAFSGQAGAAIKHGGKSLGGGAGAAGAAAAVEATPGGGFEDSWMVTAALIVSNKVGNCCRRGWGALVLCGGNFSERGAGRSAQVKPGASCACYIGSPGSHRVPTASRVDAVAAWPIAPVGAVLVVWYKQRNTEAARVQERCAVCFFLKVYGQYSSHSFPLGLARSSASASLDRCPRIAEVFPPRMFVPHIQISLSVYYCFCMYAVGPALFCLRINRSAWIVIPDRPSPQQQQQPTRLLPRPSSFLLKVPGWAEQLMGLGDRLFESDDVPAAHAMFLAAGMQVQLPTTKGARLILPGVDHKNAAHR